MTRWDPTSNLSLEKTWQLPFSSYWQMDISPNGKYFVLSDRSADTEVSIFKASTPWEIDNLTLSTSLSPSRDQARTLTFGPRGRFLIIDGYNNNQNFNEYVVGGWDGSVQTRTISTLLGAGTAGPMVWKDDGTQVFYWDHDAGEVLRSSRTGPDASPFRLGSFGSNDQSQNLNFVPTDICFSNNGRHFYASNRNSDGIHYWKVETPWDIESISKEGNLNLSNISGISADVVWGIKTHPDGSRFYVVVSDTDGNDYLHELSVPTTEAQFFNQRPHTEEGVGHIDLPNVNHGMGDQYDHDQFDEIDPDPVSCWPFQEIQNGKAIDQAGTNHLSVHSDIQVDSIDLNGYTGYKFPNDDGDFAKTDNANGMNKSELTICFWMYYRDVLRDGIGHVDGEDLEFNSHYRGSHSTHGWEMQYNGNESSVINLDYDTWNYCAGVFDGDQVYIYAWDRQGNFIDYKTMNISTVLTDDVSSFRLGGRGDSLNYATASTLFEFRWYNVALSQNQLETLANRVHGKQDNRIYPGPDYYLFESDNTDTAKDFFPVGCWPLHDRDGVRPADLVSNNTGSIDTGGQSVRGRGRFGAGGFNVSNSDAQFNVTSPSSDVSGHGYGSGFEMSGFSVGVWIYHRGDYGTFFRAENSNTTITASVLSDDTVDFQVGSKTINTGGSFSLYVNSWNYVGLAHQSPNSDTSEDGMTVDRINIGASAPTVQDSALSTSDVSGGVDSIVLGESLNADYFDLRWYNDFITGAEWDPIAAAQGTKRWSSGSVTI